MKVDATRKTCFSRRSRRVTDKAITAFRELERSRLGGRSLCIGGAAGERCDRGSVKAPLRRLCYDYVTSGRRGARRSFWSSRPLRNPVPLTPNASAAEPKRVLLVHSFASAAPPFTVESMAFETELVAKDG